MLFGGEVQYFPGKSVDVSAAKYTYNYSYIVISFILRKMFLFIFPQRWNHYILGFFCEIGTSIFLKKCQYNMAIKSINFKDNIIGCRTNLQTTCVASQWQ